MIHEAKDNLLEMGFSEVRQFEDEYGTIGYGVHFMGQHYILVAKQYAHHSLASFMAKLVLGAPDGVDFIFYNQDTDEYIVFDGEYLKTNSEKSQGPSKKRDCSWREIPLGAGANLDAFVRGKDSPATLSGSNETLDAFA